MRISKNELKYLRSLSQKKVRQAEKKFVLEGWRALKEALQAGTVDLVAVQSRYLEDPDYGKILGEVRKRKIAVRELSERELRQVSETVQSQGVMAVVRQKATLLTADLVEKARTIVAADAVTDPGNLGSLIRTADWFGVDLLITGNGSVELYNGKVIRSTAGSLFHLPVVEEVPLQTALPDLRSKGFSIIALSGDGTTDYSRLSGSKRTVLVVGSEAHGVGKEVRAVADETVRIPRFGNAESLNVGVALGIVLAHLKQDSLEHA